MTSYWRSLSFSSRLRRAVSCAESAATTAPLSDSISLRSSTSRGRTREFLSTEYAILKSSGVAKYSSRLRGCPVPWRLSNSPASIAALIFSSTSLSKDISQTAIGLYNKPFDIRRPVSMPSGRRICGTASRQLESQLPPMRFRSGDQSLKSTEREIGGQKEGAYCLH